MKTDREFSNVQSDASKDQVSLIRGKIYAPVQYLQLATLYLAGSWIVALRLSQRNTLLKTHRKIVSKCETPVTVIQASLLLHNMLCFLNLP